MYFIYALYAVHDSVLQLLLLACLNKFFVFNTNLQGRRCKRLGPAVLLAPAKSCACGLLKEGSCAERPWRQPEQPGQAGLYS